MSIAINIDSDKKLSVQIDGVERVIEVLPHDEELVTLRYVANVYYRGTTCLRTIKRKLSAKGIDASAYDKKGRELQIPFKTAKTLFK